MLSILFNKIKYRKGGINILETFKRLEEKYLLDEEKYNKLMIKIKDKLKEDKYFKSNICNIYYDTDDYELINRSLDKPIYKEKVRLRSYKIPIEDDFVFLEIKKKYKGITNKRRISAPLNEIDKYLMNKNYPNCNKQIMNEIDYCFEFYNLKPKVFIAYDRLSYYYKEDKNLRITFDANLRYRDYELDLRMGDHGELYFDKKMYIMEIKTLGSLPIWLVQSLSELEIYPVSFSKYGNIYKNKIIKEELC